MKLKTQANLIVSLFTHTSNVLRDICILYKLLYNELCKTRVLIGLEECVIRV